MRLLMIMIFIILNFQGLFWVVLFERHLVWWVDDVDVGCKRHVLQLLKGRFLVINGVLEFKWLPTIKILLTFRRFCLDTGSLHHVASCSKNPLLQNLIFKGRVAQKAAADVVFGTTLTPYSIETSLVVNELSFWLVELGLAIDWNGVFLVPQMVFIESSLISIAKTGRIPRILNQQLIFCGIWSDLLVVWTMPIRNMR